MNKDFETQVLGKLQEFGESMGENLFVAPWDVGDRSYIDLIKKIGIKKENIFTFTSYF